MCKLSVKRFGTNKGILRNTIWSCYGKFMWHSLVITWNNHGKAMWHDRGKIYTHLCYMVFSIWQRRDGKLISHRRGEKKGVKRATPFCKIWREKRSGRCILLQLYGEIDYKEESIHYRGNRNPSDRENEKTERKYTIVETRTWTISVNEKRK